MFDLLDVLAYLFAAGLLVLLASSFVSVFRSRRRLTHARREHRRTALDDRA
jgi:hypothetical protein